jgi:putative ABC transport system permease protein
MILIQMAWSNLFYNIKRTVLMILLISAALCSIILYRAYAAYSREGMKLGYIEKDGNIQIASPGFWKYGGDKYLLDGEGIKTLYDILKENPDIKAVEPVLDFSGIIGTTSVSHIFWGKAYENPQKFYGVMEGRPVFPEDNSLVLGIKLAESLGFYNSHEFLPEENFVNLMTSLESSGISLGSFEVSGITDTGIPRNDEGLVIASRAGILDFLGLKDAASYIQIYLYDDKKTAEMEQYVLQKAKKSNLDMETKNWRQLNPNFSQINTLNEVQCTIFTIILCVLIFISITQALSTAFNERLSEFGTLEAVGLKKRNITIMLILEVLFLGLLGLSLGILFSYAAAHAVAGLNIMLTFPGYSAAYPLRFFLLFQDIAGSGLFIMATCFLAMCSPVSHVLHNTVIRLIYRIE